MRKILEHMGYETRGSGEARNKKLNNADCIFCIFYMVSSLANALMGAGALNLIKTVDEHVEVSDDLPRTLLLISVNAIILFRLNIRLYIECKDKEMEIAGNLDESKKDIVTIKIKALDKRLSYLKYGYVIVGLIFLINIIFIKNGIESSLSVVIIIPILLTFYNNMIDIGKNKYDLKEKITYEFGTLDGVNIDGRNSN